MSFVHLHVHTEYSMLDGLTRMRDLFDTAKEQGSPAVAVTDHGSLGGMWQAKKHAARTGVKVIPGLEAYLAIGSRFKRETIDVASDDAASEGDDEKGGAKRGKKTKSRTYEHLTILARTKAGWANLVALQNESSKHTVGRNGKLIDYEFLAEHSDGLMVLTGCIGGPVFGPLSRAAAAQQRIDAGDTETQEGELAPAAIVQHETSRARQNLEQLISAVGRDNVYVEVMDHGNDAERNTLPLLRELAAEYQLPLVATNDSHHTHDDDRVAHAAWLAVQTKSTLANSKFSFHGTGYHLRDAEEMAGIFEDEWWQQACANTLAIAERVEEDILPEQKIRLPEFPIPEVFPNAVTYFRNLLDQGIAKRYPDGLPEEYRRRLTSECQVIAGMGFLDYFMIVHDFVTWAREQDILVGPGRGSAAGSLVAYLLDITQVDPVRYGLLFERFLEPGRAELPDVDIDFESRHKQTVLKYLSDRWGEDFVAQIGNIGKPKIRKSWKTAMQVLEQSAGVADKLSKLIPPDLTAVELIGARESGVVDRRKGDVSVSEFWSAAEKVPVIDQVVGLMHHFFETANQAGIHASGVVISPDPLTDLISMRWGKPATSDRYRWITELDHHDIEDFGLVKFDILSIRNLDMAHLCMDSVRERGGPDLELYTLPHPDDDAQNPQVRKTFDMLRSGRTAGVFQLESAPMTRLLEDVAPTNLEELSAVIALFRPGPLAAGMHTKFADRKHGREPVSYDYLTTDPTEQQWLDSVMGVTYGVFVYQEQIMALGRVVAGFDDVWRSKLRKAVSKKIQEVMDEVGAKFREGATQEHRDAQGELISPIFSEATADRIWEAMKGAAEYLFNKSHSICYALVAYYTAFLKANYAGHYGAATLSVTGTDKKEKRIAAMKALLGEGMRILPPDVEVSAFFSAPEGQDAVRIGLGEVGGFKDAATIVIEERQKGPFTSLGDLLGRCVDAAGKSIPSDKVIALIDSGACDRFGPRMGLSFVAQVAASANVPVPNIEYSPVELGVRQSKTLLMNLSDEVRQHTQQYLGSWVRPGGGFDPPRAVPVGQLDTSGIQDGSMAYVSGMLSSYEKRPYSRGIRAQVELSDASQASLPGVLWDDTRAQAEEAGMIPPVGFPVVFYGKLDTRIITIHRDSEEGADENDEGEEIARRELTVRSVYPIPVDLTPTGFMPANPFARVDLTAATRDAIASQPSSTPTAPVETPGTLIPADDAPEPLFDLPSDEREVAPPAPQTAHQEPSAVAPAQTTLMRSIGALALVPALPSGEPEQAGAVAVQTAPPALRLVEPLVERTPEFETVEQPIPAHTPDLAPAAGAPNEAAQPGMSLAERLAALGVQRAN